MEKFHTFGAGVLRRGVPGRSVLDLHRAESGESLDLFIAGGDFVIHNCDLRGECAESAILFVIEIRLPGGIRLVLDLGASFNELPSFLIRFLLALQ